MLLRLCFVSDFSRTSLSLSSFFCCHGCFLCGPIVDSLGFRLVCRRRHLFLPSQSGASPQRLRGLRLFGVRAPEPLQLGVHLCHLDVTGEGEWGGTPSCLPLGPTAGTWTTSFSFVNTHCALPFLVWVPLSAHVGLTLVSAVSETPSVSGDGVTVPGLYASGSNGGDLDNIKNLSTAVLTIFIFILRRRRPSPPSLSIPQHPLQCGARPS